MSCLWLQFLLEWINHNYFYLKSLFVECQKRYSSAQKGNSEPLRIFTVQVHRLFCCEVSNMHDASKLMALCFSTCFLFEAMFSKDLAQWLHSSQGEGFTAH